MQVRIFTVPLFGSEETVEEMNKFLCGNKVVDIAKYLVQQTTTTGSACAFLSLRFRRWTSPERLNRFLSGFRIDGTKRAVSDRLRKGAGSLVDTRSIAPFSLSMHRLPVNLPSVMSLVNLVRRWEDEFFEFFI